MSILPRYRRPCRFCEQAGCDSCAGTGWGPEPPEEPVRNPEVRTIGETIPAFFATLTANYQRAGSTGYELTAEEISPAEVTLVEALRRAGCDEFEQQKPVGPYFADFYFPAACLVVEVDGAAYHNDPGKDWRRDEQMLKRGVAKVLRLRALEVFADADGCVTRILAEAARVESAASTPQPA